MIYQAVLILHILAAVVSGVVALYTLYVLRFSVDQLYKTCALALGFISAFEVFSGTVLAVLSPELSAAALSLHISLYLGACFFLEAFLFIRMQKAILAFPLTLTVSPVFLSICLFVAAIGGGF